MEHPVRKDLLEGARLSETLLRKPKRLTLTPEKLLTPVALHEAEAEELILEAEEEMLEEVEEVAGFARKPAIILD